jgi:hypothetical protein
LTALLSLLVKKISSFCDVAGRLDNRTLPFSQHKNNCGLLLFDFANRFLIHIFALQNPQIMSISPQSHHPGVDTSSSPTIAMRHCQEKVVHMLPLVVWFVVLDTDDYFALVTF